MTLEHPVVHRYLEALRRGLDGLPAEERDEIVAEIREHVAQGLASGRDVDDVIASLGPADRLARAYALEAALNPRQGPKRWLLALAVLAAAGVPSLFLVPMLLALGLSLVFAGVVVWLAGIIKPFAPPDLVVEMDPLIAVTIGPAIALAGVGALVVLWMYARFLIRVVRRTARR